MRTRLKWLLLVMVSICSLVACSKISLGYRNAPLLATLWVDDVFDLPGAQSDAVRAALDETWDWHVGTPRLELIALMRETADRLDRPVREADVAWAFDAFDRHSDALGRVFATQLARRWPAMTLNEATDVEQHLAARRAELAEELADNTLEQQALQRTEKLVDDLEDWFGEVTDAQQVFIVRNEAMRLDRHIWLRERERRHGELIDIIKRNDVAALEDWVANWREHRPAAVVAETQRREVIYRRFWTDFLNRATPAQIAHVQRRLREWATELASVEVPEKLAQGQDALCTTC